LIWKRIKKNDRRKLQMKKSLIFFAGIFLCFAFSAKVSAQKGKPAPGCGSDFPVAVTVNDGFSITSDGKGSYINGGKGKEQVSAVFQIGNCSYDFVVNLNNSSRFLNINIPGAGIFQSKFFNFDRIGSVPVTTDANAMNAYCSMSYPQNDNYAGCGSDAAGAYVRRNVGFNIGSNLGFRYQNSPIDGALDPLLVAGTSYIKVYRPDPNTWQLAPEEPAYGVILDNGSPNGIYSVPFWFTVKRL
jgi:hypothetical protein